MFNRLILSAILVWMAAVPARASTEPILPLADLIDPDAAAILFDFPYDDPASATFTNNTSNYTIMLLAVGSDAGADGVTAYFEPSLDGAPAGHFWSHVLLPYADWGRQELFTASALGEFTAFPDFFGPFGNAVGGYDSFHLIADLGYSGLGAGTVGNLPPLSGLPASGEVHVAGAALRDNGMIVPFHFPTQAVSVPLPAPVLMLVSALVTIAGIRRWRTRHR